MSAIICLMIAVNLLFSYLLHYGGELRKIVFLPLAVGFAFACTLPALLICWGVETEMVPNGTVHWHHRCLECSSMDARSLDGTDCGTCAISARRRKLAHIDGFVIQTATVVHWVGRYPWIQKASLVAYRLVTPMAVVALFAPILIGRPEVARRYVMSVSLSILLMLVIFALRPAALPPPWRSSSHRGLKPPLANT